jgi:hypothetical protein
MELRVRNATDVLIVCEKKNGAIWLTFIDYQYKQIGKRFRIDKPERFYPLYDTYEVLKPLTWEYKKEWSGKKEYTGQEYSYQKKHGKKRY